MSLFVQALPLLVLVGLLASGRAGALTACAGASLAAIPAILRGLAPDQPFAAFVAQHSIEAGWLAIGPAGVVAGGLLFHAAAERPAEVTGPVDVGDRLFTAAFLLGPFAESVTGFGVGIVFALGAMRGTGLAGAPAVAIALLAETMIPWGGLGPGTAIGAALAGVPAQEIAARNAWQAAAWLLLLVPLFWRLAASAGHPIPRGRRPGQIAWVAACGAILVASHAVLPWEIAGVLATGPLVAVKLWRAHPPRDASARLEALTAAMPYGAVAFVLIASRAWPHPPGLKPFPQFPALALNHPMVALWSVALVILAMRSPHPFRTLAATLRRWRRPAAVMLAYIFLARVLVGAGVPTALAGALEAGLGAFAPFASPLLAAASGFFAGTNVGSNSAMMPLQAALGRVAMLPPTLLPSVQNFVGSACMVISPQLIAIAAGLDATRPAPAAVWRLAWPVLPIAIGIGLIAVAVG